MLQRAAGTSGSRPRAARSATAGKSGSRYAGSLEPENEKKTSGRKSHASSIRDSRDGRSLQVRAMPAMSAGVHGSPPAISTATKYQGGPPRWYAVVA